MIPETTAESASALAWLLTLTLGLGGLLVPGWLLTRCLPSAAPAVSAFLGSALILFHGILLLDGIGAPINVVSVALWLLATSAALVGIRRRWAPTPASIGPPPAVAQLLPPGAVKWLPAIAIGFGALLLRGLLDPLSGWDTYFRWDRLARLLLETGSLDAYPAVTAADFALYPWPEGIPPLLPVLHFWIYAVSGGPAAELTLGVVALVTALLFALTARFSRERWQSAEAGWVSVALLGTSALAGWSLAMGQETGLTALTLVAMLYFLHRYREQRRTADAVWAGLAAATGALSRDYCLVYLLVGAVTLLGHQDRRHGLRLFLGSAVAAIAPWYLRNAWITGNPLYSHDLAGLFPVNEVFVMWMRTGGTFAGFSAQEGSLLSTLRLLGVLAGPLLLAGAAGFLLQPFAGRRVLVGAAAVMGVLWLWSVHQTFGGIPYSTRILTPVLAVCAVGAGWIGRLPSARLRGVLAAVVLLLTVDASRRAWFLPTDPYTSPFRWSFDGWRELRDFSIRVRTPAVWSALVDAADGRGILVDHPNYHGFVRQAGGQAVPLFSPVAAPLFAEGRLEDRLRQLRENGIRFVVLTQGSPFTSRVAPLQELTGRFAPIPMGSVHVYDLFLGTPPAAAPR